MVHTKPGITKFRATTEGIYSFKLPTRYLKDVSENIYIISSSDLNGMELGCLISTVKDNRIVYTHQQFEHYKEESRFSISLAIQLHIIINIF